MEFERGSIRLHSVGNLLWKRQWACHKADCGVNAVYEDEICKIR